MDPAAKKEFPAEVYISIYNDGDTQFLSAHESVEEVDADEAHEGRLAVYKLVREGTVKYRPGTNRFIPNKGK